MGADESKEHVQLFDYGKLSDLYETAKTPISFDDEIPLKISSLYVHPIRSIRALPAKSIFIGPYGLKFDREIALYFVEDRKIVCAKQFMPILELVQEITYHKVDGATVASLKVTCESQASKDRMAAKGLPTETIIELDKDP
jgi:hypothetical protein